VVPGVGTVVGAVVGAVAGGLAGKGVGEMIDPTGERDHWEKNYKDRPYVKQGESYDTYAPAYQYGWESRTQHEGKSFDAAAPTLEKGWDKTKDKANLGWDKAKHAVKDAWDRVDNRVGGGTTETHVTSGTTGMAAGAQQTQLREGEQAIPVVEEELQVGKREVEKGAVRVQSHVTETPVEEQVRLREEHVHVERRPVDRPLAGADAAAFQDKTIEMHESAEQAVVSKQARVVEEVVVGKEATERTETVRDTVRRTDVDVQQVNDDARRDDKGRSAQ
jgi:uncharacterized protein (TIGR02271 family)